MSANCILADVLLVLWDIALMIRLSQSNFFCSLLLLRLTTFPVNKTPWLRRVRRRISQDGTSLKDRLKDSSQKRV